MNITDYNIKAYYKIKATAEELYTCEHIDALTNMIHNFITVNKRYFKSKKWLLYDQWLVVASAYEVKKDVITLILHNPNEGEDATDLLMIAKYFERIGDHATNISEWVIYSLKTSEDYNEI